jgi:hypothetical protein
LLGALHRYGAVRRERPGEGDVNANSLKR